MKAECNSTLMLQGQRMRHPREVGGIAGGGDCGCGYAANFLLPDRDLDQLLFGACAARGGCKRRCAVVGSSDLLSTSRFGKEIDAHDAVFRTNNAPAGGRFTKHVGRRTTVRLGDIRLNSRPRCPANVKLNRSRVLENRCSDRSYCKDHVIGDWRPFGGRRPEYDELNTNVRNASGCRSRSELYVTNCLAKKAIPRHGNESHLILSVGFHAWAKMQTGQETGFPSSGVLLVLLAQRACSEVDVFGFDFFSCPTGRRHYYQTKGDEERESSAAGNNTNQGVSCRADAESWVNHQWSFEQLFMARQ